MQKELLFEFETRQKGTTYRVRAVKMGQRFWLERVDLPDWLALIDSDTRQSLSANTNFEATVRERVEKHQISRAFRWLDVENENLYVVWRSRDHFWFDARSGEKVRFDSYIRWHKAPFWTQTGELFRQAFQQEWENPKSDAHDALAYLKASERERDKWTVTWARGSLEETETVLRAALRLEFSCDAALYQYTRVRFHSLSYGPQQWRLKPWEIASQRLQRLIEIVDERNVRTSLKYNPQQRGGTTVTIEVSSPSMHEKIEARFFLLNWLTQHAPHLLEDWN